jgi:hypothetical protein
MLRVGVLLVVWLVLADAIPRHHHNHEEFSQLFDTLSHDMEEQPGLPSFSPMKMMKKAITSLVVKIRGKFGFALRKKPGYGDATQQQMDRLSFAFMYESAWAVAMLKASETTENTKAPVIKAGKDATVLWPLSSDDVVGPKLAWRTFLGYWKAFDLAHPEYKIKENIINYMCQGKETCHSATVSDLTHLNIVEGSPGPFPDNRFWTLLHSSNIDFKTALDETVEGPEGGKKHSHGPYTTGKHPTCGARNTQFRTKNWFFALRGRQKDTNTVDSGKKPEFTQDAGLMDVITVGGERGAALGEFDEKALAGFFYQRIPHGKDFWDASDALVFNVFKQLGAAFVAAVSGTTEMFIISLEQDNLIPYLEGSAAAPKIREVLIVMWMAQLISAGHHSQTEILMASKAMGYFKDVPAPDLSEMGDIFQEFHKDVQTYLNNEHPEKAEAYSKGTPLQFFDGEETSAGYHETSILFHLYVRDELGLPVDDALFKQVTKDDKPLFHQLCEMACPGEDKPCDLKVAKALELCATFDIAPQPGSSSTDTAPQ